MMKPFELKEYLKDRNKEVVTREGKPVKILCVNLISDKPIVAEIIGEGYSLAYDVDGSHTSYQSPNDIFFKNLEDARAVVNNPNFKEILDTIYR